MHSDDKPYPNTNKCVGCKLCEKQCAHGAISYDKDGKAEIDHFKCTGCGRCVGVCKFDALKSSDDLNRDILNMKIAEYALAVVKDRPTFHINLVMDISPNCDCHSENDAPIVPDVGMLASFDPVALDMACVDLVNAQPTFENSNIGDNHKHHHEEIKDLDNLYANHPDTNWKSAISHAVKIGLGTDKYELIKLD